MSSLSSSLSIPDSFLCPITASLLKDPVMDPDGNSYEKSAILQWLQQGHAESPITRAPLRADQLRPNRALQTAIEEFLNLHQERPAVEAPRDFEAKSSNEKGTESYGFQVETAFDSSTENVSIRVRPPSVSSRCPLDLVCVVDTSGSMAENLSSKNAETQLTTLDLVKHSLKTMVMGLEAQDRLAIVSFNESASVLQGLVQMGEDGKARVLTALESLQARGGTNIYAGIQRGLELINEDMINLDRDVFFRTFEDRAARRFRNAAVLLFTDGESVTNPPRGVLPTLTNYLKSPKCVKFTQIFTFGFGSKVENPLLESIAHAGGGLFSFIPDGSFVGTIFVNAVAHLLTIAARNVRIRCSIAPNSAFSFDPKFAQSLYSDPEDGQKPAKKNEPIRSLCFAVDSLNLGQSKELAFPLVDVGDHQDVPGRIVFELEFDSSLTNQRETLKATLGENPFNEPAEETRVLKNSLGRAIFVQGVRYCFKSLEQQRSLSVFHHDLLAQMADHLGILQNSLPEEDGAFLSGLSKDLQGQVREALISRPEANKDYFRKWGCHYLRSLASAHFYQVCNNFKDPGIQFYGGLLFNELREKLDELFLSLPPPTSNIISRNVSSGACAYSSLIAQPASVSFAQHFYNSDSGCFGENSNITMASGISKPLHQLRPGDLVASFDRKTGALVDARVRFVLKFECQPQSKLVEITENGLLITPYHPILQAGSWVFPRDLPPSAMREVSSASGSSVINIILSNGHIVELNGSSRCCTIGHGFNENSVIQHEFFGTESFERNLENLKKFEQAAAGHFIFPHGALRWVRNPQTRIIEGLELQD